MSRLIEPVTGVAATQHGLLLSALAEPRAGHGIDQVILEFDEAFQPELFAEALRAVIARHPGLRTAFVRHRTGYSETVADGAPQVTTLDRCTALPQDTETGWQALLLEERRAGFDPARPPLLRATCVLLPGGRGRVLITYHHLVMDGVARDAVLAEVTACYDALRTGAGHDARPPAPAFAPPPVDAAVAAAYWRGALTGLGPESPLAPIRAPGTPDASVQSTLVRTLGPDTAEALRAAAARAGCAPATLIYAAWALCLARLSGEYDIAFLAIRNARAGNRAALRAVASLVHSAPLRVQVDRAAPAAALARAVETAWSDASPHANVPLGDIRAWGDCGARAWDSNILFHHARFADGFARSGTRRFATLGFSDVPLTVAVMRGASLDIHMRYWNDAFRPGAIDSLAESFVTIIEAIARDPDRAVSDMPWLGAAQQARIAAAAEGPAFPGEALLHGAFEGWARREPNRIALEWEGGSLTYGALYQAANALAAALGAAPEQPVAILAERAASHLVGVLATLKAGAAFLPLNPAHPDAHLARILAGAGAVRCVASPALAGRARSLGVEVIVPVDGRRAGPPFAPPSPASLAYLIATSGTTGEPKIVEVEHRAAANTLAHSLRVVYAAGDLATVPWTDSPAADASIHQIFAPLGAGGTLVAVAALDALNASPRFEDFTAFGATPSMLSALLSSGGLPPNLRAVMFGGEACPQALVDTLRARTGIRRAVNVYGPTEAAIYCTAQNVMASDNPASGRIIGRPIANVRAELFDGRGEPVMPGAVGELCIAGLALARGYRGRAGDAFTECAGADGHVRRYYRTGDMAALLPDGSLEFQGRRDRQVKVRGVRLELGAVESAIETLPGVSRALADVRADPRGTRQLVAWVVADGAAERIRGVLRDALPAAMVPSVVVPIADVPLTAAGKPDYAALSMPAIEAAPPAAGFEDGRERMVAAEWRGLLGHDRFGRDDDFFDAGGDSLMGMELLLRLGEAFGARIAASDLDGGWTIAAMARASVSAAPAESFEIRGEGRPGRPIFWMMPSVLNLPMLDGMDLPQPVYMATTDRLERSGESFEEFGVWMAARVRAVQPEGPYLLGGFCFGACAAFETAVALRAMGETVDRISLVDRPVPPGWERALRRLRFALTGETTLSWRRRGALMRAFRPSAPLDAPVDVTLTGHTAWKPGSLVRWGGWRPWVLGDLRIVRRPATHHDDGVRRALVDLAD